MSDTFKFQKDWYEAIVNDKYVKTTPQEMAYILYAAMQYAFNDKPIDLGEVFGSQFNGLNRSMANIYGQMDRIKNYEKTKKDGAYDNDAIYRLRMEGKKGKEICQILGIPLEKQKSLSTTKGWLKAREDMKKGTDDEEDTERNTESVQIQTESVKSVSTESVQNVQKSVKSTVFNF